MNLSKIVEQAYHLLGLAYYLYLWIGAAGLTAIAIPIVASAGTAWIGVGATIGGAGLVAAATLIFRARRVRRAYLNSQIDIVQQVDTYDVPENGGAPYVFTKDMRIRAHTDGVQYYQCKHKWSGSGDIQVDVSPPEIVLLADRFPTEDVFELIIVRFPRVLKKGDEESFKITVTLTPTIAKPQPYLAKLVDDFYPNGFTMCVNLPKTPRSVRKDILRSRNFNDPIKTESSNGPTRGISWEVKVPRFDRRYKISWAQDGTIA